MKYQQLENQEAQWKWLYLMRKYRNGECITAYQEIALNERISQELLQAENQVEKINAWITSHLHPDLVVKLDQAIRAKRKRFFNAEYQHTRKKSIDLDFAVWKRLADYSQKMQMTLSETIIYMIDAQEQKAHFENQVDDVKCRLKDLLGNE